MTTSYHGYIDESGTHQTAAHETVALALIRQTRVDEFAANWNAMLTKWGVSVFHMTDFNCARGEFEGWSNFRCHALSVEVVALMNEYVSFWFGCIIEAAHRNLIEDKSMRLSPYLVGGSFLLRFAADWATTQADDVAIDYTLEAGCFDETRFSRALKTLVAQNAENRQRYRYLGHRYDSKCNPGLQIADVFALQLYVDARKYDDAQARRADFKMLLKIPHLVGYFDEETLKLIRAHCLGESDSASPHRA